MASGCLDRHRRRGEAAAAGVSRGRGPWDDRLGRQGGFDTSVTPSATPFEWGHGHPSAALPRRCVRTSGPWDRWYLTAPRRSPDGLRWRERRSGQASRPGPMGQCGRPWRARVRGRPRRLWSNRRYGASPRGPPAQSRDPLRGHHCAVESCHSYSPLHAERRRWARTLCLTVSWYQA